MRPGEVLAAVEAELRAQGLTRLYGAACTRYAVLSINRYVTVWSDGDILVCRYGHRYYTWAADDIDDVTGRVVALVRAASAATP